MNCALLVIFKILWVQGGVVAVQVMRAWEAWE